MLQYDKHNEVEEVRESGTYARFWKWGSLKFCNMVIRMDFIQKVTYEQRLKGAEKIYHEDIRGSVLLTKETAVQRF